jgi:hypothetical protein
MYKQNPKSPLMKAMLGDLNKDGKMSSYETARQNAIEKSMAKSPAKQTRDKEAYLKERKAKASAYMDGLKEKRARMAEKSGDKGRAQRIRSTKDHQE